MVLMLSSVVGLTPLCVLQGASRLHRPDHAPAESRSRRSYTPPARAAPRKLFPVADPSTQAPVLSWPPDPPARKHVEAPPTRLGRAQPPEPTIATWWGWVVGHGPGAHNHPFAA